MTNLSSPSPCLEEVKEPARVAWLIEAPAHRYLSVASVGGRDSVSRWWEWTDKPERAIRFARKIDAEDVLFAVRTRDSTPPLNGDLFSFEKHLGDARATEHKWISP